MTQQRRQRAFRTLHFAQIVARLSILLAPPEGVRVDVIDARPEFIEERRGVGWKYASGSALPLARTRRSINFGAGGKMTGRRHQRHAP